MSKRFHLTTSDREIRDLIPTREVEAVNLRVGDHIHDDMVTWTVDRVEINPNKNLNFYDVNNCGHENNPADYPYDILDPYCVSGRTDLPTYAELVELLRACRPFVWRARMAGKVPHAQDKLDAEDLWPELDKAIKDGLTLE